MVKVVLFLLSGAKGIVESLSNEFIVGYDSPSTGSSRTLIVTTNGQTIIPFLVLGNQFDGVSSVRNINFAGYGISNSYRGKGIHIKAKAGGKIAIHGEQRTRFGSLDLYLAINVRHMEDVKEYEYYSIPYKYPSLLHIVATEDNTIVNLGSSSMTFDRLQTHQMDIASLTPVRVSSNKPLSVISAKNCFIRSCDYLTEQLLPTHLWGKRFLVASFLGLKNGESLRILALKFPTRVAITCAGSSITRKVTLFGPNQWTNVKLDEQPGGVRDVFCVLETSNPVHVIQFARVSEGDSYMMTIPATEQYGEFFTGFYTPNTLPFNFVNLYVVPEHYVPRGIVVDGATVVDWTTVWCENGVICGYISRPVLLTRRLYHTIHHLDPRGRIGISAYGFDTGRSSSYGYPASMYIPSPQSK